ncbi:MAG: ATP-binding cassette domain-containing protein [Planctomycetota bacterium]
MSTDPPLRQDSAPSPPPEDDEARDLTPDEPEDATSGPEDDEARDLAPDQVEDAPSEPEAATEGASEARPSEAATPEPVATVSGLSLGPLQDASLTLLDGEVTALLGPAGAGKSLLLRALLGLERPQAGTLSVADLALPRDARKIRGLVGYVPPDPTFYPSQDAASLGRFLAGLHPRWVTPPYLLLLDALGIDRDRRLNDLPLDQRLRVSLAAAFCMRPRLVLVDVPAALGDWGRELLFAAIAQARTKAAVLVADSRVHGLDALASRVAILARGRVRYTGPASSLLEQLRAYRLADAGVAPTLPPELVAVHQRGATLYARGTPPDPLPAGLLQARELDLGEAYAAVVGEALPAPRSRAARVRFE